MLPDVLAAFFTVESEIVAIAEAYADSEEDMAAKREQMERTARE